MNDNVQEKSLDELLSELKPRERNFILAFIKTGRQGEAARLAKFPEKSADVQASRLMKREDIREIIKRMLKDEFNKLCLTSESIVLRMNEIAEYCAQKKPATVFNRETGELEVIGYHEFDGKTALKANVEIARLLGYAKNEVEINGKPFELTIKADK